MVTVTLKIIMLMLVGLTILIISAITALVPEKDIDLLVTILTFVTFTIITTLITFTLIPTAAFVTCVFSALIFTMSLVGGCFIDNYGAKSNLLDTLGHMLTTNLILAILLMLINLCLVYVAPELAYFARYACWFFLGQYLIQPIKICYNVTTHVMNNVHGKTKKVFNQLVLRKHSKKLWR